MTQFLDTAVDIVAMASSAGGLQALAKVLSELPCDFPAALLIVQHLDPTYRSQLAAILDRRSELNVYEAVEGTPIRPGRVYIAMPDRHLLIRADGTLSLSALPKEQFVRPSADLLFKSVAAEYLSRTVAVVLSGTGKDGAQGALAIHQAGGTVIAQDEESSEFFGMPGATIHAGGADFVLPLRKIAAALVTLTQRGGDRNERYRTR